MAVPKKQLTKRRQGNRRSQKHGKISPTQLCVCSNCGARTFAHTVCNSCGFYKGKKIMAKLV